MDKRDRLRQTEADIRIARALARQGPRKSRPSGANQMRPDAPQTDMNIAAHKGLREKEDELNQLLTATRAKVKAEDGASSQVANECAASDWLSSLDNAQKEWLVYRNAQSDFDAYLNRGGTIWPMLWAIEASRLTEPRTVELGSWLKNASETLVWGLPSEIQTDPT